MCLVPFADTHSSSSEESCGAAGASGQMLAGTSCGLPSKMVNDVFNDQRMQVRAITYLPCHVLLSMVLTGVASELSLIPSTITVHTHSSCMLTATLGLSMTLMQASARTYVEI